MVLNALMLLISLLVGELIILIPFLLRDYLSPPESAAAVYASEKAAADAAYEHLEFQTSEIDLENRAWAMEVDVAFIKAVRRALAHMELAGGLGDVGLAIADLREQWPHVLTPNK
jgi:hypothetical protein